MLGGPGRRQDHKSRSDRRPQMDAFWFTRSADGRARLDVDPSVDRRRQP